MFPLLLRIPIVPALSRLLLLLALFALLLVAVLGVLVRATKRSIVGLTGAAIVLSALLMGRVDARPSVTIQLSAFGTCLCIAIALCCWLLLRTSSKSPASPTTVAVWICYTLVGGLIGARIGYWLLLDGTSTTWRDVINFRRGGLFGFGAYLGGLFASFCAIRRDQRALATWLDHLVLPLLLAIGIARIGCYYEGCDFGRPLHSGAHPLLVALGTFPRWPQSAGDHYLGSPAWINHVSHWGLSPDAPASLPVHPVQLYEAAFAFGLLLIGFVFRKRQRPAGVLFLHLAMAYGLGYFALGFLRGDLTRPVVLISSRLHWNIPFGSHEQWAGLGACALSWLVCKSWKHERAFWTRFRPLFRAAKARFGR
jgi:phosphatidylglycerol---prolipoprotein diacylglyceryl transferase